MNRALAPTVGILLILVGTARSSRCGSESITRVSTWTVTASSFGPIRFGMNLEEVSRVLGETVEAGEDVITEGCSYTIPNALPAGTALMVMNDHIARVDVDSAGVLTSAGVGVGMTEAEVKRFYDGRIETEPHEYTDGHYLIYTPRDSTEAGFRIVFETDGERVTNYRAGREPEVEYVEGCA
jgi:hypothetical protein